MTSSRLTEVWQKSNRRQKTNRVLTMTISQCWPYRIYRHLVLLLIEAHENSGFKYFLRTTVFTSSHKVHTCIIIFVGSVWASVQIYSWVWLKLFLSLAHWPYSVKAIIPGSTFWIHFNLCNWKESLLCQSLVLRRVHVSWDLMKKIFMQMAPQNV